MIVKAAAQYGLSVKGRSFGKKACTAKMYAYKDVFGEVSKLLKYICCSQMDFFPPLEAISGLNFSMLWD